MRYCERRQEMRVRTMPGAGIVGKENRDLTSGVLTDTRLTTSNGSSAATAGKSSAAEPGQSA